MYQCIHIFSELSEYMDKLKDIVLKAREEDKIALIHGATICDCLPKKTNACRRKRKGQSFLKAIQELKVVYVE